MVITISVVPIAGSHLFLLPTFDCGCFLGSLPQLLDQLWNVAAAYLLAFLSVEQLFQESTSLPSTWGHLHPGGLQPKVTSVQSQALLIFPFFSLAQTPTQSLHQHSWYCSSLSSVFSHSHNCCLMEVQDRDCVGTLITQDSNQHYHQ